MVGFIKGHLETELKKKLYGSTNAFAQLISHPMGMEKTFCPTEQTGWAIVLYGIYVRHENCGSSFLVLNLNVL